MPGPAPLDHPLFSAEFLDQCRGLARRRTVSLAQYQRARLALLLHESPAMSSVAAGALRGFPPHSLPLRRPPRGPPALRFARQAVPPRTSLSPPPPPAPPPPHPAPPP